MERFWELFIKGIPIGISNTLPGVSGGTMALVLKIYDDLVNGIKRLKFKILIPIFLGAVSGVFLSSSLITSLLDKYPLFLTAFLMGLILASAKVTGEEVKKINLSFLLLAIIGFVFAFLYSSQIKGIGASESTSLFRYFTGGAFGSIAMILPGISGGTILVMLGLYHSVLTAISSFNIPVIIVFGVGVGTGLLVFSWFLSYLLDNYRSPLMAFLTGLIIGSLRSVIPGQLNFAVVIGFLLGLTTIYLLLQVEKN